MKPQGCVGLVLVAASSMLLVACGGDSKGGAANGGSKPGSKADAGKLGADGGAANGGGGGSSSSGRPDGGGSNATNTATGRGGLDDVPPFAPTGDALTGDDMKWTWVDFPDTTCRDGSTGGLAVSMNSKSDKLMIFLQGGGACFDQFTCLQNGAGFANVDSQKAELTTGVFNRSNAKNPVKDWNIVFIPYCTGDVHLGTKDDGMVAGAAGPLHFVGRLNMEAYLKRIVPTFKKASQVLLTGVSAGGFGSAANAEYVQWAFGDVPVTMIDDSGPTMSTKVVPSCLQKQWRELWGFDGSILKDCGADCPNPDDYEFDYTRHVAARSKDQLAGLISSTNDMTITLFYGYGQMNCTGSFITPVSEVDFTAGLLEYRDLLKGIYPNYGTYYINNTKHTWIADDGFYTTTTGPDNVLLVDWFADIVNGVKAGNAGP